MCALVPGYEQSCRPLLKVSCSIRYPTTCTVAYSAEAARVCAKSSFAWAAAHCPEETCMLSYLSYLRASKLRYIVLRTRHSSLHRQIFEMIGVSDAAAARVLCSNEKPQRCGCLGARDLQFSLADFGGLYLICACTCLRMMPCSSAYRESKSSSYALLKMERKR